ncbi:hypothetical protein JDS99_30145 [Bacillus cereus group sp. N6]|uniref:hypothetical protein n=1 Tax=Bacillus cereus group sp. N6 TaxID=2794583 RepID=UPI0018F7BEE0|nr:hypothetical protein [Bacillus cereus group sp. N6]MBJ8113777.1 hypothetical protein [Bacillus cereus group sp. N6]
MKGANQFANIQAERPMVSGQLRVVLFSQSLAAQGLSASIGYAIQVAVIEIYVRNSVYLYQTMENVSLSLYRLFQEKRMVRTIHDFLHSYVLSCNTGVSTFCACA